VKLGIIATQADGGDTNAALLFDEILSRIEQRPAPVVVPTRAVPRTTALLRAARAAGPRITTHRLGRRPA